MPKQVNKNPSKLHTAIILNKTFFHTESIIFHCRVVSRKNPNKVKCKKLRRQQEVRFYKFCKKMDFLDMLCSFSIVYALEDQKPGCKVHLF